ncbi:MAG: sigma-70 family RNA polymerase sigma factor [Halanaerobiales bacterium]
MCETVYTDEIISSEIISGLKNKDEYALERVIDLYSDKLFRLAYVYLKDRGLAEDTVQKVFIKLYYKAHQFKEESTLYTWLYRITINQCKSKLRKWHFKNIVYTDEVPEKEEANNPDNNLLENELKKELFLHIMKLDLKYRIPLVCFYYYDLSIREIAEVMDEKENTVKTRLYRARNKLKNYLEDNRRDDNE